MPSPSSLLYQHKVGEKLGTTHLRPGWMMKLTGQAALAKAVEGGTDFANWMETTLFPALEAENQAIKYGKGGKGIESGKYSLEEEVSGEWLGRQWTASLDIARAEREGEETIARITDVKAHPLRGETEQARRADWERKAAQYSREGEKYSRQQTPYAGLYEAKHSVRTRLSTAHVSDRAARFLMDALNDPRVSALDILDEFFAEDTGTRTPGVQKGAATWTNSNLSKLAGELPDAPPKEIAHIDSPKLNEAVIQRGVSSIEQAERVAHESLGISRGQFSAMVREAPRGQDTKPWIEFIETVYSNLDNASYVDESGNPVGISTAEAVRRINAAKARLPNYIPETPVSDFATYANRTIKQPLDPGEKRADITGAKPLTDREFKALDEELYGPNVLYKPSTGEVAIVHQRENKRYPDEYWRGTIQALGGGGPRDKDTRLVLNGRLIAPMQTQVPGALSPSPEFDNPTTVLTRMLFNASTLVTQHGGGATATKAIQHYISSALSQHPTHASGAGRVSSAYQERRLHTAVLDRRFNTEQQRAALSGTPYAAMPGGKQAVDIEQFQRSVAGTLWNEQTGEAATGRAAAKLLKGLQAGARGELLVPSTWEETPRPGRSPERKMVWDKSRVLISPLVQTVAGPGGKRVVEPEIGYRAKVANLGHTILPEGMSMGGLSQPMSQTRDHSIEIGGAIDFEPSKSNYFDKEAGGFVLGWVNGDRDRPVVHSEAWDRFDASNVKTSTKGGKTTISYSGTGSVVDSDSRVKNWLFNKSVWGRTNLAEMVPGVEGLDFLLQSGFYSDTQAMYSAISAEYAGKDPMELARAIYGDDAENYIATEGKGWEQTAEARKNLGMDDPYRGVMMPTHPDHIENYLNLGSRLMTERMQEKIKVELPVSELELATFQEAGIPHKSLGKRGKGKFATEWVEAEIPAMVGDMFMQSGIEMPGQAQLSAEEMLAIVRDPGGQGAAYKEAILKGVFPQILKKSGHKRKMYEDILRARFHGDGDLGVTIPDEETVDFRKVALLLEGGVGGNAVEFMDRLKELPDDIKNQFISVGDMLVPPIRTLTGLTVPDDPGQTMFWLDEEERKELAIQQTDVSKIINSLRMVMGNEGSMQGIALGDSYSSLKEGLYGKTGLAQQPGVIRGATSAHMGSGLEGMAVSYPGMELGTVVMGNKALMEAFGTEDMSQIMKWLDEGQAAGLQRRPNVYPELTSLIPNKIISVNDAINKYGLTNIPENFGGIAFPSAQGGMSFGDWDGDRIMSLLMAVTSESKRPGGKKQKRFTTDPAIMQATERSSLYSRWARSTAKIMDYPDVASMLGKEEGWDESMLTSDDIFDMNMMLGPGLSETAKQAVTLQDDQAQYQRILDTTQSGRERKAGLFGWLTSKIRETSSPEDAKSGIFDLAQGKMFMGRAFNRLSREHPAYLAAMDQLQEGGSMASRLGMLGYQLSVDVEQFSPGLVKFFNLMEGYTPGKQGDDFVESLSAATGAGQIKSGKLRDIGPRGDFSVQLMQSILDAREFWEPTKGGTGWNIGSRDEVTEENKFWLQAEAITSDENAQAAIVDVLMGGGNAQGIWDSVFGGGENFAELSAGEITSATQQRFGKLWSSPGFLLGTVGASVANRMQMPAGGRAKATKYDELTGGMWSKLTDAGDQMRAAVATLGSKGGKYAGVNLRKMPSLEGAEEVFGKLFEWAGEDFFKNIPSYTNAADTNPGKEEVIKASESERDLLKSLIDEGEDPVEVMRRKNPNAPYLMTGGQMSKLAGVGRGMNAQTALLSGRGGKDLPRDIEQFPDIPGSEVMDEMMKWMEPERLQNPSSPEADTELTLLQKSEVGLLKKVRDLGKSPNEAADDVATSQGRSRLGPYNSVEQMGGLYEKSRDILGINREEFAAREFARRHGASYEYENDLGHETHYVKGVGWTAKFWRGWEMGDHHIEVDPSMRGKGLGTMLLRSVHELAKDLEPSVAFRTVPISESGMGVTNKVVREQGWERIGEHTFPPGEAQKMSMREWTDLLDPGREGALHNIGNYGSGYHYTENPRPDYSSRWRQVPKRQPEGETADLLRLISGGEDDLLVALEKMGVDPGSLTEVMPALQQAIKEMEPPEPPVALATPEPEEQPRRESSSDRSRLSEWSALLARRPLPAPPPEDPVEVMRRKNPNAPYLVTKEEFLERARSKGWTTGPHAYSEDYYAEQHGLSVVNAIQAGHADAIPAEVMAQYPRKRAPDYDEWLAKKEAHDARMAQRKARATNPFMSDPIPHEEMTGPERSRMIQSERNLPPLADPEEQVDKLMAGLRFPAPPEKPPPPPPPPVALATPEPEEQPRRESSADRLASLEGRRSRAVPTRRKERTEPRPLPPAQAAPPPEEYDPLLVKQVSVALGGTEEEAATAIRAYAATGSAVDLLQTYPTGTNPSRHIRSVLGVQEKLPQTRETTGEAGIPVTQVTGIETPEQVSAIRNLAYANLKVADMLEGKMRSPIYPAGEKTIERLKGQEGLNLRQVAEELSADVMAGVMSGKGAKAAATVLGVAATPKELNTLTAFLGKVESQAGPQSGLNLEDQLTARQNLLDLNYPEEVAGATGDKQAAMLEKFQSLDLGGSRAEQLLQMEGIGLKTTSRRGVADLLEGKPVSESAAESYLSETGDVSGYEMMVTSAGQKAPGARGRSPAAAVSKELDGLVDSLAKFGVSTDTATKAQERLTEVSIGLSEIYSGAEGRPLTSAEAKEATRLQGIGDTLQKAISGVGHRGARGAPPESAESAILEAMSEGPTRNIIQRSATETGKFLSEGVQNLFSSMGTFYIGRMMGQATKMMQSGIAAYGQQAGSAQKALWGAGADQWLTPQMEDWNAATRAKQRAGAGIGRRTMAAWGDEMEWLAGKGGGAGMGWAANALLPALSLGVGAQHFAGKRPWAGALGKAAGLGMLGYTTLNYAAGQAEVDQGLAGMVERGGGQRDLFEQLGSYVGMPESKDVATISALLGVEAPQRRGRNLGGLLGAIGAGTATGAGLGGVAGAFAGGVGAVPGTLIGGLGGAIGGGVKYMVTDPNREYNDKVRALQERQYSEIIRPLIEGGMQGFQEADPLSRSLTMEHVTSRLGESAGVGVDVASSAAGQMLQLFGQVPGTATEGQFAPTEQMTQYAQRMAMGESDLERLMLERAWSGASPYAPVALEERPVVEQGPGGAQHIVGQEMYSPELSGIMDEQGFEALSSKAFKETTAPLMQGARRTGVLGAAQTEWFQAIETLFETAPELGEMAAQIADAVVTSGLDVTMPAFTGAESAEQLHTMQKDLGQTLAPMQGLQQQVMQMTGGDWRASTAIANRFEGDAAGATMTQRLLSGDRGMMNILAQGSTQGPFQPMVDIGGGMQVDAGKMRADYLGSTRTMLETKGYDEVQIAQAMAPIVQTLDNLKPVIETATGLQMGTTGMWQGWSTDITGGAGYKGGPTRQAKRENFLKTEGMQLPEFGVGGVDEHEFQRVVDILQGEGTRGVQAEQTTRANQYQQFQMDQQKRGLEWSNVSQLGGTFSEPGVGDITTRGTLEITKELRGLGRMWEDFTSTYNKRSQEVSKSQFLENWDVQAARAPVQFGWQREDLAAQGAQTSLQFGWQMEDLSEAGRFATGRDRRKIQRQEERATISYGMSMGRLDTQGQRVDTQEQWSREDLDRQKRQFLERNALQDEYQSRYLSNMQTRRQLEDEMYAVEEYGARFRIEQANAALAEQENYLEFQKAVTAAMMGHAQSLENANAQMGQIVQMVQFLWSNFAVGGGGEYSLPNAAAGFFGSVQAGFASAAQSIMLPTSGKPGAYR